ncbi:DNA-binding protein [Kibdelosporangium phytohabitans]|uniref:Uncharacterized protein n=1 Tax=Kibdelosporangium phytohabitans TaxID=860235 RepID=A0A0N9HUV5_9PSEU|nr:DNA-binding protein [Kibdelosporangium phytohabitans]ALG05790.1 hypothetical protein AOZ06_01595 [Kibdelosporangium phytohabitans]MBE1466201.1 hypothetical protein [Kibdelosporangium phytohabitans]
MPTPQPTEEPLYLPAEVAAMLRCSTWWVKEQARRERIPYIWIGAYRFTSEHVTEIKALFERRPTGEPPTPLANQPQRRRTNTPQGHTPRLTARPPRRRRQTTS